MTGRPLNEIEERATPSQKVVAPPRSKSDDSVHTPAPFLVLSVSFSIKQSPVDNFISRGLF